jgi:transposase InsO family protein
VEGMDGFWLINSGCSRHMTGDRRWFSSLTPVMTKEYITFGDNGKRRVLSVGTVKVSEFVTVDDYYRYGWVFFLADKGETFGFVRDLILKLKNERHGDAVRAIRSDNDSEFKNSHFETFCRDLGLEHQFFSPYVACHNGVVERKNRSLCEMARTMLDEHRTPRTYWTEVVNTACHVGNRIFLRAFLNKTCYELMHA